MEFIDCTTPNITISENIACLFPCNYACESVAECFTGTSSEDCVEIPFSPTGDFTPSSAIHLMSSTTHSTSLFWSLFDCDLEVIDKFSEEHSGCVFLGSLMEVSDHSVPDTLLPLSLVVRISSLFSFTVSTTDDETFVVRTSNEGDDAILTTRFGEGRGELLTSFLLLDEGDGLVFLSLNPFLISCNRRSIIQPSSSGSITVGPPKARKNKSTVSQTDIQWITWSKENNKVTIIINLLLARLLAISCCCFFLRSAFSSCCFLCRFSCLNKMDFC